MKVEFDHKSFETVIHLSPEELGEILFALDLTSVYAANPTQRQMSKALYANIRNGSPIVT